MEASVKDQEHLSKPEETRKAIDEAGLEKIAKTLRIQLPSSNESLFDLEKSRIYSMLI